MKTDSRFNVILFIVTLTLFAPTWLWLGEAWLSDPYYSHGPLVVIVAVYFAWVQRKSLTMPRTIISSPSASLRMNLARNLVIRFKERDFSVALLPQNYIRPLA